MTNRKNQCTEKIKFGGRIKILANSSEKRERHNVFIYMISQLGILSPSSQSRHELKDMNINCTIFYTSVLLQNFCAGLESCLCLGFSYIQSAIFLGVRLFKNGLLVDRQGQTLAPFVFAELLTPKCKGDSTVIGWVLAACCSTLGYLNQQKSAEVRQLYLENKKPGPDSMLDGSRLPPIQK